MRAAPRTLAAARPRGTPGPLARVLVVAAFGIVVGALAYRAWSRLNVPGQPDATHWVLQDFRDAIYYPAVAFLEGANPYDHVAYLRSYPVGQVFAPYAPAVLLLYLPFALLPFEVAEALYFATTLGLTVVLARLALTLNGLAAGLIPTLALATAVLASRPGQQNLLLGQCTAHVVIGCFLALRFGGERPWLGGLGLGLALLKPHFGVPLAALMLGRREARAVVLGAATIALASAPTLGVLVVRAGGIGPFAQTIVANVMGLDANPTGHVLSGWARVDAPYLAARLLGRAPGTGAELAIGGGVLALGGLALRRLAALRVPPMHPLATCIACLAVLLSVYHQAYDTLLLVLPLVGLTVAPRRARGARALLIVLLVVPAVNYLATWSAIGSLGIAGESWRVVTAANGAALAMAFAAALVLSIRERP